MMEQAEHELLRSVGLSVIADDSSRNHKLAAGSGHLRLPVGRCTFEDVLTIEVRIASIGKKSVTYRHRFRSMAAMSLPAK